MVTVACEREAGDSFGWHGNWSVHRDFLEHPYRRIDLQASNNRTIISDRW